MTLELRIYIFLNKRSHEQTHEEVGERIKHALGKNDA